MTAVKVWGVVLGTALEGVAAYWWATRNKQEKGRQ